jgi:hypothetical protein
MKKVERSDILDYVTYEERRPEIRGAAMRAKDARRIHLGDYLTFLFENTETVRYQVLEMVRAEKIVRESDIQHELDTYNELVGGPGELCATLLIEIEDVDDRARKLVEWVGLPEKLYLKLRDGSRAYAQPDERQNEDAKISSVQFLKFVCGGQIPVAIGCAHPKNSIEIDLTGLQTAGLAADLSS